jgi:hypothetical protein
MRTELSQDEFEIWLFEMDDELDAFISETAPGISDQLDFSEESLDVLEDWMLSRYKTVDELMENSQKIVLDRIARYIGETIRKKYNLTWKIELQDPDDAYYGLPVMTDKKGKRNYECPHSLATATVDRREKGYLKMVFGAVML